MRTCLYCGADGDKSLRYEFSSVWTGSQWAYLCPNAAAGLISDCKKTEDRRLAPGAALLVIFAMTAALWVGLLGAFVLLTALMGGW